MSDQNNQKPVMKTHQQILNEVSAKMDEYRASTDKPSGWELAGLALNEYNKAKQINESLKSPEQKAAEARQAKEYAQTIEREKSQKENTRAHDLYTEWIKRDTWLIYDEAMPLATAEKPGTETLFNLRNPKLWELVQSCAGHSLKIINLVADPKKWRVKPFDWVSWLMLKEQQIHPNLQELIFPKITVQPQTPTAKAIQSREIKKRERQKALKAFVIQTENLARKKNIEWDSQQIPVTKKDFLEVFSKLNPAFKGISTYTLDNDNTVIGLLFKRGTNSNKNNILKEIHSLT